MNQMIEPKPIAAAVNTKLSISGAGCAALEMAKAIMSALKMIESAPNA